MLLGLSPHKPKQRSSRTLVFSKGCRMVGDSGCRDSPGDDLGAQNVPLNVDRLTELTYGPKRKDIERFEPKWVKMDSKVLCFEGVVTEEDTVHCVKVQYFLEDDTLKVTEPRTPNSGLWQGTLLRRGRYPHPGSRRDYNWKDLNNGCDVTIHGKTIHLIDCSRWTKQFLTDAGVEVAPPELRPADPYEEARRSACRRSEYRRRTKGEYGANFFRNGGKVLRFYGIWKDYDREPRAVRRIVLKYHLSDDSLEVFENIPPNSGWCPLLPFKASAMDLASGGSSFTAIVRRQRVLLDRRRDTDQLPCYLQPLDVDGVSWIRPIHLKTGEDVKILGKTFFLAKCDDATQQHYREKFGVDMQQVEIMPKPKPLPLRIFPPHGIGRVEETLRDCFYPTDQPPKRIHRPITPKPADVANAVLRFAAHMDTARASEQGRRFVVSFYPEDDTVRIVEEHVTNSGFGGGVFLKRGPLPKGPGAHYQTRDFYIGARIGAKGCTFVLRDADGFVLNFMDAHPEMYAGVSIEEQKNLSNLMKGETRISHSEMADLLRQLRESFLRNCGGYPYPAEALPQLGSGSLEEGVVAEKLYSANLPVRNDLLRKLVSAFTSKGPTDVEEVRRFLLEVLVHDRDQHPR